MSSIQIRDFDLKCPECEKYVFNNQIKKSLDDEEGVEEFLRRYFPVNRALLQLHGNLQSLREQI